MRLFDYICAVALFLFAIVDSLLAPRTYTGRIWIFGTCLALLFTAMLNLLRLRNGTAIKGLRLFCVAANLVMLALAAALIASIGKSRTFANLEVPFVGVLLLIESGFSLGSKV